MSRYRWMLILVASAILLASLCGGGTLMALNGGLPFGGASPASLSALSATQTARAAAIPTATPVPTETPTPVPTATPQPTATTPPPPPTRLTFSPTPLALVLSNGSCTGTQTISNPSSQQLGWKWVSPQLSSAFRFTINNHRISTPPQDMDPGLASKAQETMLITVSSCTFYLASPITVTATDSLNHSYNFVLQIAK